MSTKLALVVAMTLFTSSVKAQVSAVTPSAVATNIRSAEDGRKAGRDAANQMPISDRGVAAFFSGLPVGFFGPITLWGGGPIIATVSTVAGLSGMISAGALGRTNAAPDLKAEAQTHGSEYARAFDDSYAQRLRTRRGVAALAGGALGTGAGFGIFFYLVTHLVD